MIIFSDLIRPYITRLIIYMKILLGSDWLRGVQFKSKTGAKSVTPVQITHWNSGLWLAEAAYAMSGFWIVQINSKLNTKPCDYLYVSSIGYGVYTISATDTIAHLTTFSWSRPIRSKDPFLVCFPVAHTFFKITVWTCWWQWKKNIDSKLSDHFQTSNKEKPVWGSGLIIQ